LAQNGISQFFLYLLATKLTGERGDERSKERGRTERCENRSESGDERWAETGHKSECERGRRWRAEKIGLMECPLMWLMA